MYCPAERDFALAGMVEEVGMIADRVMHGQPQRGGGLPIAIGMSLSEYLAFQEAQALRHRRTQLAALDALLNPPGEPEPDELRHARSMLEQWTMHAEGPTATLYAIEQRGEWQRRVLELEAGPVSAPVKMNLPAEPAAGHRQPENRKSGDGRRAKPRQTRNKRSVPTPTVVTLDENRGKNNSSLAPCLSATAALTCAAAAGARQVSKRRKAA
jgi:hypothetical protein